MKRLRLIKPLFILMDLPIYSATIVWDFPLYTLRGYKSKFLNCDAFLSRKIILSLANNAESDKIQHYAVFHLGSSLFTKVPF